MVTSRFEFNGQRGSVRSRHAAQNGNRKELEFLLQAH